MAVLVGCPKCKTRLKLNNLPTESKKVQCPQCQVYFMVAAPKSANGTASPAAAAKSPARKPKPAARPEPSSKPRSSKGKWIGITAAALLLAGGGTAAYIFTRGEPQPVAPSGGDKQIAANNDKDKEQEKVKEQEKEIPPAKKEHAREKKRARDQKFVDFTRLMVKAGKDSQTGKYKDAIDDYGDALKIFPDDKDAIQGKADAEAALVAQAQAQKGDDKNKNDLTEIIKQGNEALSKRQYATALEYFKIAVQKAPSDNDAKGGFTTASEAIARNAEEQKKLADQAALADKNLKDYEANIEGAKAMLAVKNFADAYQKAVLAQGIFPDNAEAVQKATDLRKLAEQGLAGLTPDDRKTQYTQLMDQGGKALQNKRADEAEQVYKQALALFPDDSPAAKGVADAQALGMQLKMQFQLFLTQGNQALANNDLINAVNFFLQATGLFPNDATAQAALANAQQALAYTQAMARGAAAMMMTNYPAAISAFNDALAAVPGDIPATQGLLNAQQGLAAYLLARQQFDFNVAQAIPLLLQQKNADAFALLSAAVKLLPTHPNIVYTQQLTTYAGGMVQGSTSTTSKNFPSAVAGYANAVNALAPLVLPTVNDPLAVQLAPNAQNLLAAAQQAQLTAYNNAMAQGQSAMTAKNYSNAVTAYTNALAAVPNDMPATQALAQAQQLLNGTTVALQNFNTMLKQANQLMAQAKYVEALKTLNDAIKMAPDNTQAALAQTQASYADAMAKGKAAVAANNLANAIASFQSALNAVPKDAVAQQELQNAQQLQQAAGLARKDFDSKVAQANALIKQQKYAEASQMFTNAIGVLGNPKDPQLPALQTQVQYANNMATGQTALMAKNYNDAIAAFNNALGAVPKDPAAQKGIADAQQALQGVAIAALSKDFDAKVSQGNAMLGQKKYAEAAGFFNDAVKGMPKNPQAANVLAQAHYAGGMAKGVAAMTAMNYASAVSGYNEALKANPGDATAQQGLASAQQALQGAALTKNFDAKVLQANTLLGQKNYAAAAKAFNDAVKLMPGNAQAMALQTQAQYADAMHRGQVAASGKNYANAVAAYGDALKAHPADTAAQQGLNDAQNAMQAAANANRDYDTKVQQAKAFLNKHKYAEASQTINEALKLSPNNPQNTKLASDGRYADAMNKGLAAVNVRNFREAVNQFQAALTERPMDVTATTHLNNAKKQVK